MVTNIHCSLELFFFFPSFICSKHIFIKRKIPGLVKWPAVCRSSGIYCTPTLTDKLLWLSPLDVLAVFPTLEGKVSETGTLMCPAHHQTDLHQHEVLMSSSKRLFDIFGDKGKGSWHMVSRLALQNIMAFFNHFSTFPVYANSLPGRYVRFQCCDDNYSVMQFYTQIRIYFETNRAFLLVFICWFLFLLLNRKRTTTLKKFPLCRKEWTLWTPQKWSLFAKWTPQSVFFPQFFGEMKKICWYWGR